MKKPDILLAFSFCCILLIPLGWSWSEDNSQPVCPPVKLNPKILEVKKIWKSFEKDYWQVSYVWEFGACSKVIATNDVSVFQKWIKKIGENDGDR